LPRERRPLALVVWPEGVVESDGAFTATPDAAAVSSLAQTLNATVVVGVEQNVGDTRYINEVVAWGPDGRVVGSYTKNHLVPFGEYVPARGLIKRFFNLKDVPRDAIAGHEPGILHTPAGPLGVMISYQVFFDQPARPAPPAPRP